MKEPKIFKLVTVALVMVALVLIKSARLVVPVAVKFVVAKLEEVALVMVALVARRLSVLVVVALVVEAFKVAKLPVVPHNVVMVARVEVRLVKTAERAVSSAEKRLVVVALVKDAFCEKILVEVELLIVALLADRLVMVDEAEVVVEKVEVAVKLAG